MSLGRDKELFPRFTTGNNFCPTVDEDFLQNLRGPKWKNLVKIADSGHFPAKLGYLNALLDANAVKTYGYGPGSALALASNEKLAETTKISDFSAETWQQITMSAAGTKVLGLIDATTLDSDQTSRLLTSLHNKTTGALLYVTVTDQRGPKTQPLLQPTIFWPASTRKAASAVKSAENALVQLLSSPDTRQLGLVKIANVTATIAQILELKPIAQTPNDIRAWTDGKTQDTAAALNFLQQQDKQSAAMGKIGPYTYAVFLGMFILSLLLFVLRTKRNAAKLEVFLCCSFLAFVPAGVLWTFAPWYEISPWAYPAITTATALIAGALNTLMYRRKGRKALLFPVALTWILITADVILGPSATVDAPRFLGPYVNGLGRLSMNSFIGAPPQTAGRFYGVDNAMLSLLLVSAIICCSCLAYRQQNRRKIDPASLALLAIIGITIYVDGSPQLGADFGGVIPLIVAALSWLYYWRGWHWKARHVLSVIGALIATGLVATVVDYLRPEQSRSHLGNFCAKLLSGDIWPIIWRKAAMMGRSIVYVTIGLTFVAVLLYAAKRLQAWKLRKTVQLEMQIELQAQEQLEKTPLENRHCPSLLTRVGASWQGAAPSEKATAAAITLGSIVAMLINDSGALMPLLVFIYAWPFYALKARS